MCGSLGPAPLGWKQGAWVTLRNMLLPHTNFGRFIGVSKGSQIFFANARTPLPWDGGVVTDSKHAPFPCMLPYPIWSL